MRRPRLASATGTRLFAVYAAASLVPVLGLGAVLAAGIRQDAEDRAVEYGRAQAAVVEEMAIAPALRGQDLTQGGLTAAERDRLQVATDLAVFQGTIVRLRVRDFDGGVVFADDGVVGADAAAWSYPAGEQVVPADDPAFRAAAQGSPDVRLLGGGDGTGRVVRVLQPVTVTTSGRSVGVLEIVLPYDEVAAQIAADTQGTYERLAGGLVVTYLVLAAISWSTTRRLRRHAARSAHDALHDPLTGVGNREFFRRRLEAATRRPTPCAVVLVDLDRFKEVNDTLGHHAGDELLREVASRLSGAVRAGDVVARLGGDEFGLVLPGIADAEDARDFVRRISDALSAHTLLAGVALSVEASFGIALHPSDGADGEALLVRADAAMYQGKHGATGVVVYDERLPPAPTHHPGVQHDVRRALLQDELRLHYQPQVDLRTGCVTGVEALLRWQHPERGLVLPGEFLPAVEQSGVMGALTEWVLTRALADCAAWSAEGRNWSVAVNVSARNLEHPGFTDLVARLLREAGVHPSRLVLEVTETALPVDEVAGAEALAALARLGVGTALDDFGVGFASLSHLRSLALTEVKIDRAFVSGVGVHGEDVAVVRSLIQLAHDLDLRVCAEGVETPGSVAWLAGAGCDLAQGFVLSRPLPWPELLRQVDAAPGAFRTLVRPQEVPT